MINNKYLLTILVICILILITGIILFLWNSNLLDVKTEVDSAKFGQFGDYIGGILGTVFASLGFLLLIQTYKIQSESIMSTRQNQDISYLNTLYSNIIDDINNLHFTSETESKSFKGIDAFYNFKKVNYKSPNSIMDHLNAILYSIENLLEIAKRSHYPNNEIKEITITRVYYLFYTKILWPVHPIWSELRKDLIKDHDDSKFIFAKYQKLAKETIRELGNKKLIDKKKKHIKDLLSQ